MRYLFTLCGALSALLVAGQGQAGTNALDLTVSTTITLPTCVATLNDDRGTENSVVDIGDIYIPQVLDKTNSRAFSLVFRDCVSLARNLASVKLTPRTGCDGATGSGSGFRNALNGSNDAAGVSAEIWTTNTPGSSGSQQFSCATPVQRLVNLTGASSENAIVWPLSARIVLSSGSTVTDLRTGSFSTQGLFTIVYE
jgi:P pilus assembly protein, pilin FimA